MGNCYEEMRDREKRKWSLVRRYLILSMTLVKRRFGEKWEEGRDST